MDIEELRALLAVAETGSVLAASERLRMTRTTLRRRLESLEARVGAALVTRGHAGAELTPAGEEAAQHARVILKEANALLASARAAGDVVTGPLKVVLPTGLPPSMMGAVYAALRQAHPHLHLDVRLSDDPVADGFDDADLTFHFGARVETGSWVTRVVHPMRERLLASPAYLAARGTPQTLDDLAEHDLIAWRRPDADPRLWPTSDGVGLPVNPVVINADIHTLRAIVLAGGGIALLPEGRVPDPFEPPGAVVTVLPDLIGRDCPLRMIAPPVVVRSPRVRRLLEEVDQLLDGLPTE
jgi:DNA-binding transcriptional LysR family regulator